MVPTTLTLCGIHAAYADGVAYPLTACCQASGKGGATGVICRACYQPVPSVMGGDLYGAILAAGCPCPDACLAHTIYQLESQQKEVTP